MSPKNTDISSVYHQTSKIKENRNIKDTETYQNRSPIKIELFYLNLIRNENKSLSLTYLNYN